MERVRSVKFKQLMKAIIYAQLNPEKTMEQFMSDRSVFRFLILTVLILSVFG
jgi:hypothetical protein